MLFFAVTYFFIYTSSPDTAGGVGDPPLNSTPDILLLLEDYHRHSLSFVSGNDVCFLFIPHPETPPFPLLITPQNGVEKC